MRANNLFLLYFIMSQFDLIIYLLLFLFFLLFSFQVVYIINDCRSLVLCMISKRHIRFALVNSLLSCDSFVLQATGLFIIFVLVLLLLSRGLKITFDIDDVFWYFKTVLYGNCFIRSVLIVFLNFLFLNMFLLKIFAFDILMLFYLIFNA